MKTMKRKQAEDFIQNNVLGSSEVQEMLMINKSRLFALVEAGTLTPIKELKREKLFYLPDVEAIRADMMKNKKTNLFRKAGNE